MTYSTILLPAVEALAKQTAPLSDVDLEQPYAWGPHHEGIRFALIGTYHELRELAVDMAAERAAAGTPLSKAQHALGLYHSAYRDLQVILLAATEELYGEEPAPGEWPLRYVLGHIVGSERHFYTLVHYGVRRQREGTDLPAALPEQEIERVLGSTDDLRDIMENWGLREMLGFYEVLHKQVLEDFADASDTELEGPSVWWEQTAYPLQHRLHRFDAHLRQHTVQAEKTLQQLGRTPSEAQRLLRLVYAALAEVEGYTIGAPALAAEAQRGLAEKIRARTEAVAARVANARRLQRAVRDGAVAEVQALLQETPELAHAVDEAGLSLVLRATYVGRHEIVTALMDAGAELDIFSAAATGHLDAVEQAAAIQPDIIDAYSRDGFTPLQLACYFGQEAVALWLLEQGADVALVSRNGSTLQAIHAAAAGDKPTIVEALLGAGADANARQSGDFTPLHSAAQNGNVRMITILLQHGADPAAQSAGGKTAAEFAREKGAEEALNALEAVER